MAGERVLVIDDNPQNLKLARLVLQGGGFEVRAAEDAEEAIRMLDIELPDAILMDVQLPGIDGLTLTRQLKADPARRHIVVIALTAYAMKGDADRMRAAGCDGYVTKPIDVDELPRTVSNLLAARRQP